MTWMEDKCGIFSSDVVYFQSAGEICYQITELNINQLLEFVYKGNV